MKALELLTEHIKLYHRWKDQFIFLRCNCTQAFKIKHGTTGTTDIALYIIWYYSGLRACYDASLCSSVCDCYSWCCCLLYQSLTFRRRKHTGLWGYILTNIFSKYLGKIFYIDSCSRPRVRCLVLAVYCTGQAVVRYPRHSRQLTGRSRRGCSSACLCTKSCR